MVYLLQPECNFLHGFFRCKFPVEVVDIEVNVTSMQGTHIFRRDRTTQLIRCIPWSTKLCPHPTIVKKMKTFLEVENKIRPIILALVSQFRPPLPETNPNFRKSDTIEKRKRATPKKKFRPATPRVAVTWHPLLQAPPKPSSSASSAPVREDTPWPGTGKILGNLFEDRNWLLPKDYLVAENKKEDTTIDTDKPPLKEESKMEEQATSQKKGKCGWGPDCPFSKSQKKEGENQQQQKPLPKPQARRPDTLSLIKMRQQWEAEMERLNSKYNLDCFSDSDSESECDEGEQYQYEHGYETLIWRVPKWLKNSKFFARTLFSKSNLPMIILEF